MVISSPLCLSCQPRSTPSDTKRRLGLSPGRLQQHGCGWRRNYVPRVAAAHSAGRGVWAAERRAKAVVDKVDAEAPPLPSGATVIAVS